ncbi:MAG: DUF4105 domain-containing protein [Prevotella sp.]
MKRFNCFLRTLSLVVFIFLTAGVYGQETVSRQQGMDSVEISLLTCSPGTEVWSLYGHTAIRIQDLKNNEDVVVNYGLFDYQQDNFILRFVFGLTDYQVGISPYRLFLLEYAREGRSVVQQTLHLSDEEKVAIINALTDNLQPINRVYRYNFFYDNCTTRARDMITDHLQGKVEYAMDLETRRSYREMIHQWNASHRWASFGCDLLLGLKADFKTDFAHQQFLPNTLQIDFDHANVVLPEGEKYALVDSTTEVLRANPDNVKTSTGIWDYITPTILFFSLSIIVLLITIYEFVRRKTFWLLDVILLTLDGLAGLVLFVMIFSQHPTVSLNLQILLLNPLSIVFVYPVVNQEVKRGYHWYWDFLGICLLLFLVGGFFQSYAEGMTLLASILLIRVLVNRIIYKLPTKKK